MQYAAHRERPSKGSGLGPLSAATICCVGPALEAARLWGREAGPCLLIVAAPIVLEYPGEIGVGLQHLGILVGPQAYVRVWPEIISWLRARR